MQCSKEKCNEEVYSESLCFYHYRYYVKYSGKFKNGELVRNDCIVPGCCDLPTRKGLCDLHYKRKQKFGDPNAEVRKVAKRGEPYAFLCEEIKKDTDECMIWPYATIPNGYGVLNHQNDYQLAHRLVCTIVHGEPPFEDAQAAHLCGNGRLGCFNPRHLKWTDQSENQMHRVEHGTSNRGEAHGLSKRTEAEILHLRDLILSGKRDVEIHKLTGEDHRFINMIRHGKVWGWLTGFGNEEEK